MKPRLTFGNISPLELFEHFSIEEREDKVKAYKPGTARMALSSVERELEEPAAVVAGAKPKRRKRRREEAGVAVEQYKRDTKKIGRNDPCPCGSGKKYKKCCGKGKT